MMDCKRAQGMVELLAGGDLDPGEEREVRQHLESCSSCRERFASARAARAALGRLRFEEMERELPETGEEGFWSDLADSVMERLAHAESAPARGGRLLWFGSGFAAAASLLVLVWLVFLRGESPPQKGEEPLAANPLERVEGPLATSHPKIVVPRNLEGWTFRRRELEEGRQLRRGGEEVVPVGGRREDL